MKDSKHSVKIDPELCHHVEKYKDGSHGLPVRYLMMSKPDHVLGKHRNHPYVTHAVGALPDSYADRL